LIRKIKMEVTIQMYQRGKVYGYEYGALGLNNIEYWDYTTKKERARVHDLPKGELTEEMVDSFAWIMQHYWHGNEQLITIDVETGKPIAGYCFVEDEDGIYEMRRFEPEEEE